MSIPLRRSLVPDVAFTAGGGVSTFRLPKGQPHKKAYLLVSGTVTLTGAGTAVKPQGVPLRQVQLVTDNGVTPHSMRGRDLLSIAQLMEQTPLASMYTPPSNFTVAAYNFTCAVPLFFYEPKSNDVAEFYTHLPSWAYTGDALVRITWGDVTEMFAGSPVGSFSNMSVSMLLLSADKLDPADARAPDFTGRFVQTFQTFTEVVVSAGGTFTIDLPRTEDTRNILLIGEDATGAGSNAVLGNVTVEENNAVQRVANIPFSALQAETAQVYGIAPPNGVASIDFADDNDVANIAPSTSYDQFQIRGNALVAGTVRVVSRRLGALKR